MQGQKLGISDIYVALYICHHDELWLYREMHLQDYSASV